MSAQDLAIIIAAIVAGLGTIGAGIKWIVSLFVSALDKTTTVNADAATKLAQAVTDSSAAVTRAVNESTTAQVAAMNSLRLELREHRVETRVLWGLRPPDDDDPVSEDGEPAPLTPIRGVPATPTHLIVNRKGKP